MSGTFVRVPQRQLAGRPTPMDRSAEARDWENAANCVLAGSPCQWQYFSADNPLSSCAWTCECHCPVSRHRFACMVALYLPPSTISTRSVCMNTRSATRSPVCPCSSMATDDNQPYVRSSSMKTINAIYCRQRIFAIVDRSCWLSQRPGECHMDSAMSASCKRPWGQKL